MTQTVVELHELHGAELVDALEQRFTTEIATVETRPKTFSILRPRNSDDLIREEDFVCVFPGLMLTLGEPGSTDNRTYRGHRRGSARG